MGDDRRVVQPTGGMLDLKHPALQFSIYDFGFSLRKLCGARKDNAVISLLRVIGNLPNS
jgi:hypothetical protein